MKARLSLLALVALLLGVVYVSLVLPEHEHPSRSIRTMQLMDILLRCIEMREEVDVSKLAESIKPEEDSLLLNRRIAAFLRASSDPDITNSLKSISSDGLFRDAWETPLLFLSTNSVYYEKLNPVLKDHPRPFALWSAGRNRTNEFGYGDDIFLHR